MALAKVFGRDRSVLARLSQTLQGAKGAAGGFHPGEPRAEMIQAAAPSSRSAVILLILFTLLALPYFWSSTFSGLPWFDDEGTLLVSIRAFIQGHRMYDDVYSLYGPLFNLFYGLLYGPLHIPADQFGGRLIALSLWLTWTAGFAFFCFRLSRSLVSMLLCFMLTVRLLGPIMHSPGHPEELCLVLISATLLMTCSLEENARDIALAGIGAAIAALTLIKINVGVFVGLPLLVVLLRKSSNAKLSRTLAPLAMICMIILPVALQSLLFSFSWVRMYCLFCFLSVVAAGLVYLKADRTPPIMTTRSWAVLVASGGVSALLIVGAMMLAGSSAFGILNAVVLQNTGFVRNWYYPIYFGAGSLLSATVSLLAAGAYWVSGKQPRLGAYRKHAILVMQSIFILAGLWFCVRNDPTHLVKLLAPFCWLLLTSPDAEATPFRTARSVTVLMSATMLLYAFPVAGHQINIVAVLPLVAVAVLSREVASALSRRYFERVRWLPWMPAAITALVFVLGGVATLRAVQTYATGVELGLPGTSFVRVTPHRAQDLHWVSSQLSNCSASYSIPGLYSFSLWTGKALPTTLNVNAELNFLSRKQQRTIVRALSRKANLCVVFYPDLLKWFDRGQAAADPPLLRYVSTFKVSSERDGYIILRRHAGGT
jgi:hypothetical protein